MGMILGFTIPYSSLKRKKKLPYPTPFQRNWENIGGNVGVI
jgi:hypothetical protein